MKKLMIILALVLSTNSMAANIAEYRFAIFADDHKTIHVFKAAVTDTSELEVEMTTSVGRPPFFFPQNGEVVTKDFSKRLNKHVFKTLKELAVSLSNAKITKKENQIICMMMPGPALSNNHLSVKRGFDHRSGSFLGDMELVSGPNGCWVRNPVFPEDESQRGNAASLKSLIKVLVLDEVGTEI